MTDTVQTAPEAQPTTTPDAGAAPAPTHREEMLSLATKLLSQDDKAGAVADAAGEVAEKPEKARAPDGKFAKADAADKEGEAAKAAKSDDAASDDKKADAEGDKKEAAKPYRDPPSHWKSNVLKEKWADAPPEVQDVVSNLALRDRQEISKLGRELSQLKPFETVVRQNIDYFKEIGEHPAKVMNAFIAWDRAIKADPERAGLKFLAAYGIDASRFAGNGQPADASGFADPEVDALRNRNQALERRLAALEGQTRGIASHLSGQQSAERDRAVAAEAAKFDTLQTQVEEFAKTHPDFHVLAESGDLEIEIQALRTRGVPEDRLLQMAYDRASHANPVTRDRIIKGQLSEVERSRAKAAEDAAKAAKRAGAVNVRGAPENTAPPRTLKDAHNAVLAKYGMGQLS